jgi:hypothetical protein
VSSSAVREAEDAFRRARQLFDQQQYAAAADGFMAVVKILEREDPAFELRWTANEFASVSRAFASRTTAKSTRVYTTGDEGVAEPVALAPNLPPLAPPGTPPDRTAVLELLIDTRGSVESVRYLGGRQHYRDRWWLSAAKAWQFSPAIKDGQAVNFLKRVVFLDGESFGPS